jgi:hypothetical protein
MNKFQFGQSPDEKSCGWRCLYYLMPEDMTYNAFLERFKYLQPIKKGIMLSNISSILGYHGIKTTYTIPTGSGTYCIWVRSKKWNFLGGHFFVYKDGYVYDSLEDDCYKLSVVKLVKLLETTNRKNCFVCMRLDKKKKKKRG